MKRIAIKSAVAVILGLFLVSQAGCLLVAAAAGTGATVAYVRGDLESNVDADPKTVADAAERALKSLDIAVISKEASLIDGKVQGRTARDVKITVVIKGESEKSSHVSVRMGTFGDAATQSNILEHIRKELTAPATASAE
jgi:hypothetical protein